MSDSAVFIVEPDLQDVVLSLFKKLADLTLFSMKIA